MNVNLDTKVKFTIDEILKNVYHLNFIGQLDLCSTFLRFQEYYESPKFKGTVFTLDEYIKWYSLPEIRGAFTYYTDWSGMNIPSYCLEPFFNGLFDPLTTREQQILDVFDGKTGKYYIIGTHGKMKRSLKHEIAHALFYISDEYQLESTALLKDVKCNSFRSYLLRIGYDKDVMIDEIQAYLVSNINQFKDEADITPLLPFRDELEAIYRKYEHKYKK
ncbi:MAG: ABC transporter ATP-binding protein [Asgard group archaeon]|nr:ABC transporter ATP-binding protein [Asgard group archaeon]